MKMACIALLSTLLVTGCVTGVEEHFDEDPKHSTTIDMGPYLIECQNGKAWYKNEVGEYVRDGEC